MKLVSYLKDDHAQLAFLVDGMLYDLERLHPDLPVSMAMFLNYWEDLLPIAHSLNRSLVEGNRKFTGIPLEEAYVLSPVPNPTSLRESDSFRVHAEAERKARKQPMASGFDKFPGFSIVNHNSVMGPGEIVLMPDQLHKLDFGMQVAVVIGKPCRNVKAAEADECIAGYVITNALKGRGFYEQEWDMNSGSPKSRDFATTMGPLLVSTDELEEYILPERDGHQGKSFNLDMKCRVNGELVSEGVVGTMEWNFAEIIERCSYGVQLFPGDVITSGTVGTGCFLEFNETGRKNNPQWEDRWLKQGDEIEIEVEELGVLKNTIVLDEGE
ncbi:MAG: fumarylacetoacetate hydrolase family protein [Bacteroidota bacterium]|nr:fumarylacetoacetate hydrolase family protein [Bacteroidota bacterium]